MPEEKIIKLCSASRMAFRARIHRTDTQNIGGQFGTLSGFFRRGTKSPEVYLGMKSFRTIFEKRTPAFSLGAPLLGLAKFAFHFWCRTVSCAFFRLRH